MNPLARVAVLLTLVALGAAGAIYFLGFASGPPRPSPTVPSTSIEGTWDADFTRAEMLAAGIVEGEDDPENYGHFRLSFADGTWDLIREGLPSNAAPGTYTVDGGVITIAPSGESVTFSMPITVTATTLAFGPGGPVPFRVEPWVRIGGPGETGLPALSPLAQGTYVADIPVAGILSALDAETTLSAADKTAVIDDILGIRGATTLNMELTVGRGTFNFGQGVDGGQIAPSIERAWALTTIDAQTVGLSADGGPVGSWRVIRTGDGLGFTLVRLTEAPSTVEAFVSGVLFDSVPYRLKP